VTGDVHRRSLPEDRRFHLATLLTAPPSAICPRDPPVPRETPGDPGLDTRRAGRQHSVRWRRGTHKGRRRRQVRSLLHGSVEARAGMGGHPSTVRRRRRRSSALPALGPAEPTVCRWPSSSFGRLLHQGVAPVVASQGTAASGHHAQGKWPIAFGCLVLALACAAGPVGASGALASPGSVRRLGLDELRAAWKARRNADRIRADYQRRYRTPVTRSPP
jgi:hypothetical protein